MKQNTNINNIQASNLIKLLDELTFEGYRDFFHNEFESLKFNMCTQEDLNAGNSILLALRREDSMALSIFDYARKELDMFNSSLHSRNSVDLYYRWGIDKFGSIVKKYGFVHPPTNTRFGLYNDVIDPTQRIIVLKIGGRVDDTVVDEAISRTVHNFKICANEELLAYYRGLVVDNVKALYDSQTKVFEYEAKLYSSVMEQENE